MSLAASLFTRLSGVSSATGAIAGTGSACKVYPGIAPAGTTAPYVVVQTLSTRPALTMEAPSGLSMHMVQLSCVSATYIGALVLSAAVVADLDNVTLAAGEKCIECSEMDGFSETTDQFLRIVEALIWAAPG